MKRNLAVLCVMVLAVGNAYCGADVAAYPEMKRLLPPKMVDGNPLSSFEIDEEIFAATTDDFSNMRLLDSDGAERPFLVRVKKTMVSVVSEEEARTEIQALEKESETNLIIIAVRKDDETRSAQELEINTDLRNFEKQVAVYGSDDRQKWECLAAGQPIYDYSRYLNLRNERVRFKKSNYKYHKVEISNISESSDSPLAWLIKEQRKDGQVIKIEERNILQKDFRIDRLRFLEKVEGVRENKNVQIAYATLNMKVSQDKESRSTYVTFETKRVPVRVISLVTESRNFSRSVVVEGASGKDEWRRVGAGTISRVHFAGADKVSLAIPLDSESRFERYRIVISDQDSPPLTVSEVKIEGDVCEAMFFADIGKTYLLYFGAENVPEPRYDIASVIGGDRSSGVNVFKLQERESNPDFKVGKSVSLPGGKVFLIIAILASVAVLFWVIVVSVRKLEPVPEYDGKTDPNNH